LGSPAIDSQKPSAFAIAWEAAGGRAARLSEQGKLSLDPQTSDNGGAFHPKALERHRRESPMTSNQTYVKTEVVGSSNKSVSDAIESAIATASRSLRNLDWFEVVDVRGSIRENKVANYQVTLKLGLRYDPKA
jgi:flavin-binding protein dodecin